ncbi:PD-(D/E)XK nuclease-like domain-containing protein [Salinispora pacifica]|uniref:PD-(D/E)XK nuclease-like domain-containing protein n=1 Tax=Salinispora pacifica TaxID=351187 RepID=UPI0003704A79|nr:PD-(D/E)XK nuclease-like domain-containing protein [Salinispora pacifica]
MTTAGLVVTDPGVYAGIRDTVYHADPVPQGSLSSSGARRLIPPSCPAIYKHWRDSGQNPKRDFDLGQAAHSLVLGAGPEIVEVTHDNWRTNAAKDAAGEARQAGKVPLLTKDYEVVQAMAAKLREHPTAAALLRPEGGRPELSMFWVDPETRIWCRARTDWLDVSRPGRLIVPDYKTCVSAAPDDLQRVIWDHGYHQQADWYLGGLRALGVASDDSQFVFIFQEKRPPYLVTVAQPDPFALRVGSHLNRQARHLYRECVTSGRWPGYTDDVALISLPGWVENRYAKELS